MPDKNVRIIITILSNGVDCMKLFKTKIEEIMETINSERWFVQHYFFKNSLSIIDDD